LAREDTDSAPYMPKGVVTNPYFDWRSDTQLRYPWHEIVLYELHVKGFTATHPDIPEELRGTYAGIAHPVAVEYLTSLGVTAEGNHMGPVLSMKGIDNPSYYRLVDNDPTF
jgi:isoamylase